jgi:hypothetical protein
MSQRVGKTRPYRSIEDLRYLRFYGGFPYLIETQKPGFFLRRRLTVQRLDKNPVSLSECISLDIKKR